MHESFEDKLSAADELLDRAASQIRESAPSAEATSAAAERVWKTLAEQPAGRRAMRLVRDDDTAASSVSRDDSATDTPAFGVRRSKGGQRFGVWALAAVLVMAVGVGSLVVRELWPAGPSATVQTVDGQLFRVAAASQAPLAEGAEILEHEAVRTGRDGGAVIRLEDGSMVELAPRSEVSIDEGMSGTTIRLERGNVIVEAAKQRDGHLYVATDDCLVSVTGTVFSVNHGTKGSRVSVIEGEVVVDHGGEESVLHPGDQVTTHALLAPLSVADEIAWSRDLDNYLQLLREFSALERELEERVPTPGLRSSSRLLDLVPEQTVFYAALPNLTETVTETHRVLRERIDESPALAEWWNSEAAGHFEAHIDEAVETFSELGGYIGEEIVVAGQLTGDENEFGAVVLAELVDAAGLRDFVERHGQDEVGDDLTIVDDPSAATGSSFVLWLDEASGLAVGSNSATRLQAVAGHLAGASNPFVGGAFHSDISSLYDEGAGILVAADLSSIINIQAAQGNDPDAPNFAALGIDNVRHLMLEQKQLGGKTHHRAAISFDDARHGMASWLAEPSPMGGLDFVSPDAKLVTAVVFRDPSELLDDIFALSGEVPEELSEIEERFGLSVRDDIAGALGGEMVFAIDGPLVPVPAWKVVIEVYDPARFQWAIEQALVEVNRHLAEQGHETVELTETEVGGRTVYTVPATLIDIHYTFVEGYLLMAPNRALLDQAIRYRDSGYSITSSPKLLALLPQDGRNNVSALAYYDLAGVASMVAERLAQGQQLTPEQQSALDAFDGGSGPTLGYAYGETDRITLAAASDGDVLRAILMRMVGVQNPAGFEQLFGLFDGVVDI
ncbi:MAG: FecR domain-containing protein [Acidobacteriota bacterium]